MGRRCRRLPRRSLLLVAVGSRQRWLGVSLLVVGLAAGLTGCSDTTRFDVHAVLSQSGGNYEARLLPCWHGPVQSVTFIGQTNGRPARVVWAVESRQPKQLRSLNLGTVPGGFRETHPYRPLQPKEHLYGAIAGPSDFSPLWVVAESQASKASC